jgi:YHS domain-containing protein
MSCCEKLTTTAEDPVCGMTVDPARAAGESEYQGETYFFCSTGCKGKFDRSPSHTYKFPRRQLRRIHRWRSIRSVDASETLESSHFP